MCSLTTPEAYSSGIDQPPNSANFAPRATWRSWSGEVQRGRSRCSWRGTYRSAVGRSRAGLSCPGDDLQPAQRQPRQDPRRRGGRRARAARQGAAGRRRAVRTSPRPTAASSGRCWPPSGVTGKAGEVAKVPTGGTLASPLLVLVGLGKQADADGGTPGGRRRRPRGHERRLGRASRCPPTPPSWSGR